MATSEQVKRYLAYWFQLGKPLLFPHEVVLPQPVMESSHYSAAFEACWQRVLSAEGKQCYLDGMTQSMHELLDSDWDISDCARCGMPVPMISLGIQSNACPCFDLPTWPNTDLPFPRSPVDSHDQLSSIRDRLTRHASQHSTQQTPPPSP